MKHIPVRDITASRQEPDFSENFSIRDIRQLLAGKDMVQELHRHNFFYILALKKATGKHEIDFTPYPVGDNTIFFLRPGQVHQLTLEAGSTGWLLGFKPGLFHARDKDFSQLLRKAGNTNLYQPGARGFKKLAAILTYIFREYTGKQEGYQAIINANLDIFFIGLARQGSKSPAVPHTTYAQERLQEFSALLETHISGHKQVAQYAGMMHLSPYQLNAITRTTMGKTCSELINDYIILESKRYLLATSGQVNQIAGHLGYEDVSYFIRFFKKHTGYSPEAFRHKYR